MERGKFGKKILIFELSAVVLISLCGFVLAAICILKNYTGSLPWITAMIIPSWAAYGASKTTYNNKTMKESLPYCQAEASQITCKRDG